MKRSLERKLTLKDWEVLTVAQIVDYIVFYDDDESETDGDQEAEVNATQDDFERF